MTEYIERDAFLRWVHEFRTDDKELASAVINAPAKDVAEVKHASWELTEDGAAYCTACKRKMNPFLYGYGYCALCGARMDGDRE